MTKLDEMWTALAAYQPKADADGHGVSWAKMCSKRTSDAAVGAAYSYGVTYAAARAADFAARAADFAAASAADDYYAAAAADYAARAIEYIKEALAQQDAETHLQAVSDFGQLQALSEPSDCRDCFCLQENAQDNDVICDPCRWAKESLAQPEQLHSTKNFCMTDERVEILATLLHCVPREEDELRIDLNAFCHDARTAIIKAAQPAQDRCTHGVWAADHCYECAASQPAQEPVAWIDDNGNLHRDEPPYSYGPDPRPLYLVPPQRQPLRGEQIYELFVKTLPKLTLGMTYVPEWAIPIARAIEAKHGIGDKT